MSGTWIYNLGFVVTGLRGLDCYPSESNFNKPDGQNVLKKIISKINGRQINLKWVFNILKRT